MAYNFNNMQPGYNTLDMFGIPNQMQQTNAFSSFNAVPQANANSLNFNTAPAPTSTLGQPVTQQNVNTGLNPQGVSEVSLTNPSTWNWDTIATGANAVAGIGGLALDYMNYQNAVDTLDFQKDAWQKNYDQSLAAYNRQVERQDARDASARGNQPLATPDNQENK